MPDEKILGGEGSPAVPEDESKGAAQAEGTIEITPLMEDGDTRIEGGHEISEGKYNEILSKVAPQATPPVQVSDDDAKLDAKSIGATIDEESKVEKLLQLAETKGVVYAVKVARSLSDYYALDRMHDELVDKLYEGLLAKGLIQKD
jgi:hypothetical protein